VVRNSHFQRKFFLVASSAGGSHNVYTKKADYFAHEEQMEELLRRFAGLSFVVSESLATNWFTSHRAWAAENDVKITTSQEYVASVKAFLATDDGAAFSRKVVFTDDGSAIAATEIETYWQAAGSAQRAIDHMRDSRRTAKQAAPQLRPVVYSTVFPWLEALAVIIVETVRALAIACTVVVVVLVCLLGDLPIAALVSGFVASVCVCTFGAIYWYGLSRQCLQTNAVLTHSSYVRRRRTELHQCLLRHRQRRPRLRRLRPHRPRLHQRPADFRHRPAARHLRPRPAWVLRLPRQLLHSPQRPRHRPRPNIRLPDVLLVPHHHHGPRHLVRPRRRPSDTCCSRPSHRQDSRDDTPHTSSRRGGVDKHIPDEARDVVELPVVPS